MWYIYNNTLCLVAQNMLGFSPPIHIANLDWIHSAINFLCMIWRKDLCVEYDDEIYVLNMTMKFMCWMCVFAVNFRYSVQILNINPWHMSRHSMCDSQSRRHRKFVFYALKTKRRYIVLMYLSVKHVGIEMGNVICILIGY